VHKSTMSALTAAVRDAGKLPIRLLSAAEIVRGWRRADGGGGLRQVGGVVGGSLLFCAAAAAAAAAGGRKGRMRRGGAEGWGGGHASIIHFNTAIKVILLRVQTSDFVC
jgi:hypothetical protein